MMKKLFIILLFIPVGLTAQTSVIILDKADKDKAEYWVDARNVIRPIQLPDGTWFIRTNLLPFVADKNKHAFLTVCKRSEVRDMPEKGTIEKDVIYKSSEGLVVAKRTFEKVDDKMNGKDFHVREREVIVEPVRERKWWEL